MSQILLSRIGNNIKTLRQTKGISKMKLAKDLNMNRKRLNDLEHGEQDIRVATLVKIANYFDVVPWVLCSTKDVIENSKMHPYVESDLMTLFVDKIAEINMTQSDLATEVNISTINRIIKGRYTNPCISTIEIIAETANLNLEDVFRNIRVSEKEEEE